MLLHPFFLSTGSRKCIFTETNTIYSNDPMYRLVIIFSWCLLGVLPLQACGYSFIGECGTAVHLEINGTPDSFNLSHCVGGIPFEGLQLGALRTLRLSNATCITWESCQNNVSAARLYYRVYVAGNMPGGWQQQLLYQEYDIVQGPYTTRYRHAPVNYNLCDGLTEGLDYILEVYLEAEVDTLGDDYIAETVVRQNNNGANYRLQFHYAGASGPPFTVVQTRQQDAQCYGDSSGIAGVSVYGAVNGLFYAWSNQPFNFHTQMGLPAGAYTVSVSNSSGYTQSLSMNIGEPPPVPLNVLLQTPVVANCSGVLAFPLSLQYQAISQPGVQFQWSLGGMLLSDSAICQFVLTEAQMLLPQVRVTDAQGCIAEAAAQLSVIWPLPLQLAFDTLTASGPNQADGAVFSLASGGLAPLSFQWDNGATLPDLPQVLPGQYCLTLTDARGCTQTGCTQVGWVSGTTTAPEADFFQIYPNPCRAGTVFYANTREQGSKIILEIFDTSGRCVRQKIQECWPLSPVPADFPPGAYLVQLRQGERTMRQMLYVF
jgi:hypothetical protein